MHSGDGTSQNSRQSPVKCVLIGRGFSACKIYILHVKATVLKRAGKSNLQECVEHFLLEIRIFSCTSLSFFTETGNDSVVV